MLATIIVGGLLGLVFFFASRKTLRDIKNNQCSGCSGCSPEKKSSCHKTLK